MTRKQRVSTLRLAGIVIGLLKSMAPAADLPAGYVIHEGTQSPDGHYGIAVPTKDFGDAGGTNYLADPVSGKVLGTIHCKNAYFEHEGHISLDTLWAAGSKRCVVIYKDRYGDDSIEIVEPSGGSFTETNISDHIQKALAEVTTAKKDETGTASSFFRTTADGKLIVHSVYFTPGSLQDSTTQFAVFEGKFDLDKKAWLTASAHRMKWKGPEAGVKGNSEEYEAAQSALDATYGLVAEDGSDTTVNGAVVTSDKAKAEGLDEVLNVVYRGVRALLPPKQFEAVKKDQIAWLKKLQATKSVAEKCKMLEARIEALKDLLW